MCPEGTENLRDNVDRHLHIQYPVAGASGS
jgi:hypothetical protein